MLWCMVMQQHRNILNKCVIEECGRNIYLYHSDELHGPYSPDIVRVIKSRRIK